MTSTQIAAALDQKLPVVFVAINPKAVRALATRAGRPYIAEIDSVFATLNEPRVANQDVSIREISWKHAGRQVVVLYAKVRGYGSGDVPQFRTLAVSVEEGSFEAPDRHLEKYLSDLRSAVSHRGEESDAVLAELTGASLKWDAEA